MPHFVFPKSTLIRIPILFLAVLVLSHPVRSASLTGTVAFDSSSGIYTYSYTLQNMGGSGRITQLYVGVNSIPFSSFAPLSHTEPAGWAFDTGFSGGPPPTAIGSWQWHAIDSTGGLPEGDTLTGFSFQTLTAPGVWNRLNYEVFFPDGLAIFENTDHEFGQVVSPDYLLPEPENPPSPSVP